MKKVCTMKNERKVRFWSLWREFRGNLCAYCGDTENKHTIDHVIPKSKGGTNRLENLVAACFNCNQLKGDLSLQEFGELKVLPIKAEELYARG